MSSRRGCRVSSFWRSPGSSRRGCRVSSFWRSPGLRSSPGSSLSRWKKEVQIVLSEDINQGRMQVGGDELTLKGVTTPFWGFRWSVPPETEEKFIPSKVSGEGGEKISASFACHFCQWPKYRPPENFSNIHPWYKHFDRNSKGWIWFDDFIEHVYAVHMKLVPSQTVDRQTLDTKIPSQANTRHDKP